MPVDWTALIARVRDPRDRAAIQDLQRLDRLRGRPSGDGLPAGSPGRSLPFLRCLVAVAVLQVAVRLGAAGMAVGAGRPLMELASTLLPTLAFAGAGLLLGAASSRDRRSFFLLATFVLSAGAFARAVPAGPALMWPAALDAAFRGVFPEAFAPAALWHFAVVFPHVRRFTPFDLFARRAIAVAWVVGAVLFFVNLALAYRVMDGAHVVRLGRDHAGNLFWDLFTVTALGAVVAILARSRWAPPPEQRRVARFATAIAAGTAPFLLAGVARMALPGVDGWLQAASPQQRLWFDVPVVGALAALPVLTTLAVIADRPFEFQFAPPWPMSRWTRKRRSRWRMKHRERLSAALERVRHARSARELVALLQRELQFGVGAGAVRILDRGALPSDTALMPMLAESTAVLEMSRDGSLFRLMPRHDREWLEAGGITLIGALKLRDGTVAALVGLGAKRGRASFDGRDRWFVSTLLSGAAVAWASLGVQPASPTEDDEPALECPRCGRVSASETLPCGCEARAVTAALPCRVAGKFMVVRRLGSGGMGVVYLGRDSRLHRDVALKTLPELRDGGVSGLTEEARAMAALNHEAVATIYGLEMWRRTPVLVVEYFPDGTLRQRLARGPLSPREVIALGTRLAGGLAYMHERGVLHRDVKPSNIGLTGTGAPKLLDFGLASEEGAFAGTPGYLPPEALEGGDPNTAVDLWGLSTVLLEACGGRDRLPLALRRFFDRALAAAPASRFQSAHEFRAALDGLATQPAARAGA